MNILRQCWRREIEAFLFFGELNARRITGTPLTEADRIFIRMNKPEIIEEIKSISAGKRISGKELYGALLEDRQITGRHAGVHREGI